MEKGLLDVSERELGKGVGFERIRRITGYLVGTLDRFNTAKRSEVEDRVKHSVLEQVEYLDTDMDEKVV